MHDVLPMTAQEAREIGSPFYFTGLTCINGHVAKRYTKNNRCIECNQLQAAAARKKNPEYNRQYSRAYNPGHYRRNKHEYFLKTMKRRGVISSSALHSMFPCGEVYKDVPEGYQVDHIYPLQGIDSCGLHVPWNLQIIPVRENSAKSNKSPEDFYGLTSQEIHFILADDVSHATNQSPR